MPIKSGDRVLIKPEWRSPNKPADFEYFAVCDEEKGIVDISPMEWNYKIRTIETVDASMLEILPAKTKHDFSDLAGKGRFMIVARRNGKTVYATVQNMQGVFTENPEFAYVYDAQDNGDMKLKYWTAIAKMRGIDAATVEAMRCAS